MIEVNLLPWRAEQHAQEKRNNKLSLGIGTLVGLSVLLVLHTGLNVYLAKLKKSGGLLENLMATTQTTTNQISKLKEEYEASVKQFNFLKKLESKQRKVHEELKQIISIIVPPVIINEIRQVKNLITLKGEADSIEKLQQFVIQLDKKNCFSQIQLKEINQLPRAKNFYFVLTANVKGD